MLNDIGELQRIERHAYAAGNLATAGIVAAALVAIEEGQAAAEEQVANAQADASADAEQHYLLTQAAMALLKRLGPFLDNLPLEDALDIPPAVVELMRLSDELNRRITND